MKSKGPNLSGNPKLVPGVICQGRLYPVHEIGHGNPVMAYHDKRLTGDGK